MLVLPMLPVWLITGEYTLYDMRGEFFALPLLTLLILPFFTTLAVIAWKNSRRWNLLNTVAWSLAFLPGLWLAVSEQAQRPGQLWGVWLFIVVAIAMAALEWTSLRASRMAEPGTA